MCQKKLRLFTFIASLLLWKIGLGQVQYQPYSYQFYQKLNDSVYAIKSRIHSSIKPFRVDDSQLIGRFNEVMDKNTDTLNRMNLFDRKLFHEHLINIKKNNATFFADYLPDLTVGRDLHERRSTWLNAQGLQIGGTISGKLYLYASGFINRALFPSYIDNYIHQTGIIPGQASSDGSSITGTQNWNNATFLLSYTPSKHLNVAIGHDKNFIGDGYRSMLLSDVSSPYSFLKLTGSLGDVDYMVMWGNMQEPRALKLNGNAQPREKWAVFHYLDWNVNNRLTLGFFDSIIWGDTDDSGHKRGFDYTYSNPIIFLRPLEADNGSPDNALIGFNGKFKLTDCITIYGQFALDEFEAKNFFSNNGSSRNKYGWQIGLRGRNPFKIKHISYLLEYNGAKPYTYSSTNPIKSYAQKGEPLGHPFGANFKEVIGILNYAYKRIEASGQVNYGYYGLDAGSMNYGKDVYLDYSKPTTFTGPTFSDGVNASNNNYIGQGITTRMWVLEPKISYLINPNYNLRVEISGLYRLERNNLYNDQAAIFSIGVRSSFRNIYRDLASYKAR